MTSRLPPDAPIADLRWCASVVRQRAGNFYWGLRLLPEPKRSALYALYAWMRRADDIVDDASDADVAGSQLEAFAQETQRLLEGGEPQEGPLWASLAWTHKVWPLPPEPFAAMIDGQRADLHRATMETADELRAYCRQVASSVGRLCIEIWGYDDPAAPALAEARGIALQLTNVLRDIGTDAALGRCYIPSRSLAEHGLDLPSLVGWHRPDHCMRLLESWIAEASAQYEYSSPLDAMIDPSCRRTLSAMTGIYHALLERLAEDPRRCVGVPATRLSTLTKIRVALRRQRGRS